MLPLEAVKQLKIGVLMGGLSAEREISLKTGKAVLSSLQNQGYRAIGLDVDKHIALALSKEEIELAFIALHGPLGEDGSIQGLLEVMGIPYTGSGVLASALGMNKIVSKKVCLYHGIAVPEFAILSRGASVSDIPKGLKPPVVVKPSSQGSSVGVSIVRRTDELDQAVENAFKFDNDILIERFIEGKEVHVGVLGDRALGGIEILPETDFYDYTAKYTPGMSKHIFPAPLEPQVYERLLELALNAHQVLGCRGYSRVDFLIAEEKDPYLLEVNTLPGMTPTSLMPEIAQGVGISFDELIGEILVLAMDSHGSAKGQSAGGERLNL